VNIAVANNKASSIRPDSALDTRLDVESGRVPLTGMQALVLAALLQARRDRAAGHHTGGFVSGYRGSPLSGLDQEFQQARRLLETYDIHLQPGVNEDLAATAVWGSQQIHLRGKARVDGVFGMWYGKGAGLDRSVDVIRHANSAGTHPLGGVLAVVGDDPAMKSSAQPHHCEPTFADLRMPVLYPANVSEVVEYALYGWALSRFSGCWVGLKTVPETVNTSGWVDLTPELGRVVIPAHGDQAARSLRWPDPWPAGERRFAEHKLPAVRAFSLANPLDRVVIDGPRRRLGIVAAGKSFADLMEALALLGLSRDQAAALGLSVYKPALLWPLEEEGLTRFAADLQTILVIEEKRSFLEAQIRDILYAQPSRPVVIGRQDADGGELFPTYGEIGPEMIARELRTLLAGGGFDGQGTMFEAALTSLKQPGAHPAPVARAPFFCSGCPHNTSTKVPDGSLAMAGIGCHGMAMWLPDRSTALHTHMGGEGATWIGESPFSNRSHVFQNLGDGTYCHSGSLAIRAAVAAGVNITYKILYNDAVAMTGGQGVDSGATVGQITRQLQAEGVAAIRVVAEMPERHAFGRDLAPGTLVYHRDELDAVQRELRDIPGVTALVFDQTCATEKRRRRKRGLLPPAPERVVINERVCEGCGDCSAKSNCMSVVPLETEFGRKRTIDSSNCNADLSCLKGFCPSFVTVSGRLEAAKPVEPEAALLASLPEPLVAGPADGMPYSILVTGIGGTGVVTIGALLSAASHMAGLYCSVHDRLGMAQKYGAVTSHIRIAKRPDDFSSARIPAGGADLLIGGDVVVSGSPEALAVISRGRTRAVVNSHRSMTGAFTQQPDLDIGDDRILASLQALIGADLTAIEATALATALAGDAIATNVFLLGYAFQKGWIPLPLEALEKAMVFLGIAVAANRRNLAWGRLAAHDLPSVLKAAGRASLPPTEADFDLERLTAHRADHLAAYQDQAYADRFLADLGRVRAAEAAILPGRDELARAFARGLSRLMAYKDEYEVARLFVEGDFLRRAEVAEGKIRFHLAPPLLAKVDPATGEPKKMAFGPWIIPAFRILSRLKRLRGTAFDLFGRTEERRMERALIEEYRQAVFAACEPLTAESYSRALEVARLADKVRGFGPVKARNAESFRAALRPASTG
jgi:indolepyruvate ferredoxin oxidoreductase